jgi:uncharacterized protein (TIGR02284 family)
MSTTTTTTDKSVKVLNELIAICEDGAQGFAKAAEDAHALPLHTLFSTYASQRASYAAELKREVSLLGEKPEQSGHVAAAFHRGWMSIKEVVGNKDKVIIDECEAGEDKAVKAYRDALEQPLTPAMLQIVKTQLAGVSEAHNKLRSLKHSMN